MELQLGMLAGFPQRPIIPETAVADHRGGGGDARARRIPVGSLLVSSIADFGPPDLHRGFLWDAQRTDHSRCRAARVLRCFSFSRLFVGRQPFCKPK